MIKRTGTIIWNGITTFFSLVSESYYDDYLVGHTGVSDLEVDPMTFYL